MHLIKHRASLLLAAVVLAAGLSEGTSADSTTTAAVVPQDYAAFVGAWTGTLGPGEELRIEVDPDIGAGGEIRYWYGDGGPWTYGGEKLEFKPGQIRLIAKNGVLLGPVDGNKMLYLWTGKPPAEATLTRE